MYKRTKKDQNFTCINNGYLRRKDLSTLAKGLFTYILSLPDDWRIYKTEIFTHLSEGRTALNRAWKELIDQGYLSKEILRNENGRIEGCRWDVYEETKIKINLTERQVTERQVTEHTINQTSENEPLLNTNKLITNKLSTKKTKTTTEENELDFEDINFTNLQRDFTNAKK